MCEMNNKIRQYNIRPVSYINCQKQKNLLWFYGMDKLDTVWSRLCLFTFIQMMLLMAFRRYLLADDDGKVRL